MAAILLSNSDNIHIKSDECLLRLKTLNNSNMYLKYKKGTKTFDDIKNFLFNNFKYSCEGYNNQSMFDFKFNNTILSKILPKTNSTVCLSLGSGSGTDYDNISSELLDIIASSNTCLNLILNYDNVLKTNKELIQIEYDTISHLFSDVCPDTLYIKTLGGNNICFKCDLEKLTIRNIKVAICQKLDISINDLRIIYAGKQLDGNDIMLSEYKIKTDSNLHILLRLRGGMFNEVSGRNGNYEPLQDIFYDLDSGFEINLKSEYENHYCWKSTYAI
jgi:hypothetical protein